MSLDVFFLYLATWSVFAISPGPAVLFVMSQAARHGQRGALAGTAGILVGHVFCFTAVAFGLVALLASFSGAVTAIRILGAAYLMYLGARMLFSKRRDESQLVAAPAAPAHHGIMLQGLGVQLTNPKNLLFVLALLPQFIRPDHPLLLQLAIMLFVTMLVDGASLMTYAQLAIRGARALKGSRAMLWMERVFGTALIYFGVKLLASRR